MKRLTLLVMTLCLTLTIDIGFGFADEERKDPGQLVNKNWFNKLQADLQIIFIEVIEEESAKTFVLTRELYTDQSPKAKAAGIEFITLSDTDKAGRIKDARPVQESWAAKTGSDDMNKVRTTLSN
jgi:TRAP-type C4-dicarboxylate transport system substrate-binding protein